MTGSLPRSRTTSAWQRKPQKTREEDVFLIASSLENKERLRNT